MVVITSTVLWKEAVSAFVRPFGVQEQDKVFISVKFWVGTTDAFVEVEKQ
jgi:hypothetical protein